MSEKVNENKLLTPITIFAGIVEVCGLIVLPSYSREVQEVFQWFLMFFPVFVVSLFFTSTLLKSRLHQPAGSSPQMDEEKVLFDEKARLLTADPGDILQGTPDVRSEETRSAHVKQERA